LTHTLALPDAWSVQRRYIARVVEAVGGFDNVLYEVGNELDASVACSAWQEAVLAVVREEERARGHRQHPCLRTVAWPSPPSLEELYASTAEAISPNCPARHGIGLDDLCHDPPPTDGRRVVLLDTDHLWGVGGDADWVWRAVLRGYNPLFMDPWEGDFVVSGPYGIDARSAMGVAARLSDRIDLAGMRARPELVSSRYAMVDEGLTRLVAYLPWDGPSTLDLGAASGALAATWLHPVSGLTQPGPRLAGGTRHLLASPFHGPAVLVAGQG
jgi:hypothetical protein